MKKKLWQLENTFNYIKVNKFLFVFHASEEYHLNSNINPFFFQEGVGCNGVIM